MLTTIGFGAIALAFASLRLLRPRNGRAIAALNGEFGGTLTAFVITVLLLGGSAAIFAGLAEHLF